MWTKRLHAISNRQSHAGRVGPVTRRLVYALALLPVVPAAAVMAVNVFIARGWLGPFDEFRWFHFFFASLWVVGTVAIWRGVIIWTLGRVWLTALVGMIPFVQVVYGEPLWSAGGCLRIFEDEMLRVGQHEIGIGVYVWMAVWVWWGWERFAMRPKPSNDKAPAVRMTSSARRLAASIGTIPFVFGTFLIAMVALDDYAGLSDPLSAAYGVAAAVAAAAWFFIWKPVVAWSGRVTARTAALTAGLLFGPIAVHSLLSGPGRTNLEEVILASFPVIGWGVWMAASVSMWPARASGVSGPLEPRCPGCRYLLVGLRSTRCPECGAEPTLDELWRASFEDLDIIAPHAAHGPPRVR